MYAVHGLTIHWTIQDKSLKVVPEMFLPLAFSLIQLVLFIFTLQDLLELLPQWNPILHFFMPAHQKSFLFISYLTDYYSHGHQSCSFPTKSSTWYHDNVFPPKIHISSSLSLAPNFQWCITSSGINIRIPSTDEFELAHFYFSKIISKYSIHT